MPDMSWMSPKRRRTTGNLKTLSNGQSLHQTEANPSTPTTPTRERSGSFKTARPLPKPRPFSSGSYPATASKGPDGNLFYAYARKSDELRSRYLLTFASVGAANAWWLLIQAHFPDCTRPGPQLFSFTADDFLESAWKHPAFEHLKTKWMYISFGEAQSGGIGGAAQGIIPVQNTEGNMVGGSASVDASPELGQARKEVKDMRNDVSRLEEHFEKMMEAVENNTEGVKVLAEQQEREHRHGDANGGSGYFDMNELSGHFGRMTDLLARNMEHVENMSKRQFEHEQRLSRALEGLHGKQKNDSLDMSQLSKHLDRINDMMEKSITDGKNSSRQSEDKAPAIDFSPLTSKLEKMQEAVESNSKLIKALLDEGAPSDSDIPRTPFWGNGSNTQQTDLSPLEGHLQKIHGAIEEQSSHMKALVGFASGEGQSGDSPFPSGDQQPHVDLAPLGEHLEQIYNEIEQGNRAAKQRKLEVDLSPLNDQLSKLIDAQNATREAVEQTNGELDFTPLADHMEAVKEAIEGQYNPLKDKLTELIESQSAVREAIEKTNGELDVTPLADQVQAVKVALEGQNKPLVKHLQAIHKSTDRNSDILDTVVGSRLKDMDFTSLAQKLDDIKSAVEQKGASKDAIDLTPLAEHLKAIQKAANSNTNELKAMNELQKQQSTPSSAQTAQIDLTPLTDRLNRIHKSLEKANNAPRDTSPGSGDPKFVLSALSSHLSKIQTVTEQNAAAVKTITNRSKAVDDKLKLDTDGFDRKLEATSSQVRELMAGHREMTKVMRDLAEAITAQNKGNCDHIVIPPPRKVGRKLVGFVYDAKDGPA